MNKEKRYLVLGENQADLIARASKSEDGGKMFIEGYAFVFEQRSKLIYEYGEFFYEIIARGALDGILEDSALNVVLTRDHIRTNLLARTKSGTLTLTLDEIGLKYRAQLPNTELGRETFELVERGDLFESSFIFRVEEDGQTWRYNSDNALERTITKIRSLHDVAVVVDGAYANTDIDVETAKRAIVDLDAPTPEEAESARLLDLAKKETELFKLKM
jgi:hypothetical protein